MDKTKELDGKQMDEYLDQITKIFLSDKLGITKIQETRDILYEIRLRAFNEGVDTMHKTVQNVIKQ